MRGRGLKAGETLFVVSALALFVVMFFTWYGSEVSGQAGKIELGLGTGVGGSAWQTLDVISFVLMLTVAVAAGAGLLRVLDSSWEPAVPLSAAVAVLGGLCFLLILFRILDPPDFGTLGGVTVNATPKLGVFLGLAAAAGIAYGGYRAMCERGTSFAGIADRLSAKRPETRV